MNADSSDPPRRYVDSKSQPLLREALRALADEQPSEDSCRATLEALGVSETEPPFGRRLRADFRGPTLLRWTLLGLALGVLIVAWWRF